MIILRWTGGLIPYALAVGWGLVGAIVGTLGAGQPVLTVAAAVGLLIVAVATVVFRRGQPRGGQPRGGQPRGGQPRVGQRGVRP